MKIMKLFTIVAISVFALSVQSCTVQESVRTNRGVLVKSSDHKYNGGSDLTHAHVRNVEGTAKKTRIGRPNTRIRSKTETAARNDLFKSNPPGENQGYTNVRVEAWSTGYLFFRVHHARATAEIVEVSARGEE